MPDPSLSVLRDWTHQAEGFPEWMGWLCVVVMIVAIVGWWSGGDGT